MTDETDLVSKGYVTTFFLDIDLLRNSLTGYRSIILRIKQSGIDMSKINKTNLKISEELNQGLINWSDSVRNSVERCHISYKALVGTIPNLKSDQLDTLFDKIKNIFSPDVDDVEKYTFEVHKCFVQATLHEVLNKMDSLYESKQQ